jgi:hypothetical protein
MNGRLRSAIILASALALLAPGPLAAQGGQPGAARQTPPKQPLSRTPDGQPDVRGAWGTDAYTQDLETGLPDEETNTIQGRGSVDQSKARSVISDPADGRIPYQPWAAERRIRIPTFRRGDVSKGEAKTLRDVRPQTFCLIGLPRLNWYGDFELLQIPGYVVMEWEWSHAFRIIPLDPARPHPPSTVKLSMGDARGHWENNTLVVETSNMNDWDWFDATGTFHSDAMTMVERFSFVDTQTMNYEVTITDPKVLTRPFTIRLPFEKRARAAGYELLEAACVEGEKGAEVLGLAKAKP